MCKNKNLKSICNISAIIVFLNGIYSYIRKFPLFTGEKTSMFSSKCILLSQNEKTHTNL